MVLTNNQAIGENLTVVAWVCGPVLSLNINYLNNRLRINPALISVTSCLRTHVKLSSGKHLRRAAGVWISCRFGVRTLLASGALEASFEHPRIGWLKRLGSAPAAQHWPDRFSTAET